MERYTYFDTIDRYDWPHPSEIERYFLAPKGREWFFASGNDSAVFWVRGRNEPHKQLPLGAGVDIYLYLHAHSDHGVMLNYSRWDGRTREKLAYGSRGDLSRLREWVRSLHGDLMPVGLFLPFAKAWPAVKEFLETDGELPTSIEWIASRDLPADAFPEP